MIDDGTDDVPETKDDDANSYQEKQFVNVGCEEDAYGDEEDEAVEEESMRQGQHLLN